MVARVLATAAAVFLGVAAFWFDALGEGHFVNPFGIMFLLLGALVWFAWRPIREGFRSARNESELPVIRLGAAAIKGMWAAGHTQPRRSSGS